MKLDPARSTIAVYTFAEGLFSALAHDLELRARAFEGDARGEDVTLRVPVDELRVEGVVKRGTTDRGVLSSGDRDTIERQIRDDVLRGADVRVRGTREGAKARIQIDAPTGHAEVACAVEVRSEADTTFARGEVELSLRALGVAPVKGPMGAFRVADRVRVRFELAFAPSPGAPSANL